jgi:hypothetical protein
MPRRWCHTVDAIPTIPWWWHHEDDSIVMTPYWWPHSDDAMMMMSGQRSYADDSMPMTPYWWHHTDDTMMMTPYWWYHNEGTMMMTKPKGIDGILITLSCKADSSWKRSDIVKGSLFVYIVLCLHFLLFKFLKRFCLPWWNEIVSLRLAERHTVPQTASTMRLIWDIIS